MKGFSPLAVVSYAHVDNSKETQFISGQIEYDKLLFFYVPLTFPHPATMSYMYPTVLLQRIRILWTFIIIKPSEYYTNDV